MSFYNETPVKAVRKARQCAGCRSMIEVGQPALNCAGHQDDFWHATYHHECRKAEIALNDLHDIRWADDWINLGDDMEDDDWPWLLEEFPTVAERMNITAERIEKKRQRDEEMRQRWLEQTSRQPKGSNHG